MLLGFDPVVAVGWSAWLWSLQVAVTLGWSRGGSGRSYQGHVLCTLHPL